jgi:hypothetical protein
MMGIAQTWHPDGRFARRRCFAPRQAFKRGGLQSIGLWVTYEEK